jgi:predicted aconitase
MPSSGVFSARAVIRTEAVTSTIREFSRAIQQLDSCPAAGTPIHLAVDVKRLAEAIQTARRNARLVLVSASENVAHRATRLSGSEREPPRGDRTNLSFCGSAPCAQDVVVSWLSS